MTKIARQFYPLQLAVLTVSDSRTAENDSSGDLLCQLLTQAGHQLVERAVLPITSISCAPCLAAGSPALRCR